MKLGLRNLLRLCLPGVMVAAALTAGPVLHLTPGNGIAGTGGDIIGAPGSTVGWAFTLHNDLNWIEVFSAQFCLDSPVGNPCFTASPQFVDIISNPPNDVIVGPSGSVSQIYSPGSNLGLGSFNIDPGAANGSSVVGNILLTYNTFDDDPNNGGNQIGFQDAIAAAASVTAVTSSIVPEPGTLAFAGFALTALGALRRRQRT
jgi:hypothetical protein